MTATGFGPLCHIYVTQRLKTPKLEVGDGPCIRPTNISRSSAIGCVAKVRID